MASKPTIVNYNSPSVTVSDEEDLGEGRILWGERELLIRSSHLKKVEQMGQGINRVA